MPVLAQRLVAIVGPTASGKTALAIDVARRLRSEIVSVDSRQVYRGLDLGTGKDKELYAQGGSPVASHLLDVVEPGEVYSLFRYQQAVYDTVGLWRDTFGPWHPLIFCGGTGLYLEAVLRHYAMANVPEDPDFREAQMQRDKESLWTELQALDPEWAARTDASSKKRLVRSLEVARQRRLGPVPLSTAPEWTFSPLIFVVQMPREALKKRIAERLQSRLDQGLLAEVQALMSQGLDLSRLQQLGLEYREIGEYLAGYRNLAEMQNRLQEAIAEMAKRQVTWFRGLERRGLVAHFMPEGADAAYVLSQVQQAWPDVHARFAPMQTTKASFALAVLQDPQGRVLLLRRSLQDSFGPGLWGLPGGHLQPGESPEAALDRELREELGEAIQFSREPCLPAFRDSLYGGIYEVHLAKRSYLGGDLQLNAEHSEYAWVTPETYAGYDVVPGVDEDLAYLQVWPLRHLNPERLPAHLKVL